MSMFHHSLRRLAIGTLASAVLWSVVFLVPDRTARATPGAASAPPTDPPTQAATASAAIQPTPEAQPFSLIGGEDARRKVSTTLFNDFDPNLQYDYFLATDSIGNLQSVIAYDGLGRELSFDCVRVDEWSEVPPEWTGMRVWMVWGIMSSSTARIAVGGYWFKEPETDRLLIMATDTDTDRGLEWADLQIDMQIGDRANSGCQFADAQYDLDARANQANANACSAQCFQRYATQGVLCGAGAIVSCGACVTGVGGIACPACLATSACLGHALYSGLGAGGICSREYHRVMECACLAAEARAKGLTPPNCPPFKCPCN